MNQPVRKYTPPKKKKRVINSYKRLIAGVTAIIAAVVFVFNYQHAQAVFDETNSVRVNNADVENGTLLIGTHLIYVGAMTNEIYKQAVDSQATSGQYKKYYKSEIAPGAGDWYDISSASSLADISTAGIKVPLSEILEVRVTHHTKSDGKTYDLLTGQSICIFDNPDPYKIEGLAEMEPLKNQYDLKVKLSDSDKSALDKHNVNLIYEMFSKDYKTDQTQVYDGYLISLQNYYDSIAGDKTKLDKADAVYKIMSKCDAARRMIVLNQLKTYELPDLLSEFTKQYKEDDATFTPDSMMISAAGDSIEKVESSYNTYSANALEEGETVLSKVEYRLSNDLINAAVANNYTECDAVAQKLVYLNSVMDEVIKGGREAADFIESDLVGLADEAFRSALSTAAADAYENATESSTAASNSTLLTAQKSVVDGKRSEMQFILRAKIKRLSTADAITYVTDRLNNISNFSYSVPDDDFKSYGEALVNDYKSWLQEQLVTLNKEKGLANDSVAALEAERDELSTKRLSALDKNDLTEANRLEAEIENKNKQINAKKDELNKIINSSTASDAEKANAQAQLGTKSDLALLEQLKQSALSDINNGMLDNLDNTITAISALSSSLPDPVLKALQEIYEALANRLLTDAMQEARLKELMSLIEGLLADNMNHFIPGVTEADMGNYVGNYFEDNALNGSSDDAGFLGSDSDLNSTLGSMLGKLSDKDLASALIGMDMYTKATNSNVTSKIVSTYAQKMFSNNSKYVYEKYQSDLTNTYVNAETLAKTTGYRTIFKKSLQMIVLQKGNEHYDFRAFSTAVESKNVETLTTPAGFQKVVYIPADFCESHFNRIAVYLEDCGYAVLTDKEGMEEASKFFDYLMGMEG